MIIALDDYVGAETIAKDIMPYFISIAISLVPVLFTLMLSVALLK